MADHYKLWSTIVGDLTREEFDWLDQVTTNLAVAVEEEDRGKLPDFIAYGSELDVEEISVQDIRLTDGDSGCSAWFHSDGCSGDQLEIHAMIIQEFFRLFRPKDFHEIHWSVTCSGPIADQSSGGGCAFVTAKEIIYHSTWDWASDKAKELGFVKEEGS